MPSDSANFPGSQRNFPSMGNFPSSDSLLIPGNPLLFFNPFNVNLLNNSGLAAGSQVGTYKNSGLNGSTWDVFIASSPAKPIFRVASNGVPYLESNGSQYLNSNPGLTAIPQPTIIGVVFKVASLATSHTIFDGGSATNNISVLSGSGIFDLYSGTEYSTQAVTANTWTRCISKFNGATSFNVKNGSQSANGNAGTNQATMASLFNIGAGTIMNGSISTFALWGASNPPSIAAIDAYLKNVTPV